jgi:hypothetical protein
MKKIMAITLFLWVFFIGCDEAPEDYSIGEITITGIPADIPVSGNDTVKNNTYRVYLNASDSQSKDDPSKAKGWADVETAIKQTDGTYTVIIKLENPNPLEDKDPTKDTGSWSGTANNFSVVISPKNVSGGENVIWAKAGTTLNKGKKNCDWNKLFDFRTLGLNEETNALFTEIVCQDHDIIKSE